MITPLRSLLAASVLAVPAVLAAADLPVSFNRDIRPIMSDTCFHCHGNDSETREGGLRFDLREETLKPTKNGVIPIVPGKPDESEMILRIFDDVEPMPPDEAHKKLTPKQKDLLRRWVAEGAVYEQHWAYSPLSKPALPPVVGSSPSNSSSASVASPISGSASSASATRHPIDAFIHAKLAEKKIAPSPAAPKAQLLRRLSLDLTGLPPTPDEVAAFLADTSPRAYEKQVERLLASPHHGERMAVWWLDIARFSDTVGFHGDQQQRIFPYRDYVVSAFNTNKPFDQFTIEQLAGDLLPQPTTEQIVATGYNRLNMMTREGGAQAKEYLAKYGAERVRSVAAAWFGSTFGCAECHDHKFDPIKASDFYELQSFFADVKQWGVYSSYDYSPVPELEGFNNDYPFPPELVVTSPYLLARKQRLEAEVAAHQRALGDQVQRGPLASALEAWIAETRALITGADSVWRQPALSATLMKGNQPAPDRLVPVSDDLTVTLPRALARNEPLRLTVEPGVGRVAALRLEVAGSWPNAPKTRRTANATLRLAASVRAADGKLRKLDFVFADATSKETRYEQGTDVLGVATGWRLPAAAADSGASESGVWLLATPHVFTADEKLVLTLTGDTTPKLRVFTSPLAAMDPLQVGSAGLWDALKVDAVRRTPAQHDLLVETWLLSTGADRAAFEQRHSLYAQIRETRQGQTATLITEAMSPLTVRVLPRGNWLDETGPVVLPATPSFLPGRLESTAERRLTRLDLAHWIVSPVNPITARTVMNRLWSMYFGSGLSGVIDDLGSQGELPSHPELLDWLASELREKKWDLRHMIRLIVTSDTYRQSSSLRPELRDVDPANRLLASQNPRRLEAEFVRDNALFIAGALNLRDIGGPSAKPYQPAGYYAALQFPDRDYLASQDDEQWRRGVYMHWQRTFLHPMLANFDAPSRDECSAQRVVSNTPQQALTLLNDPTFVEAARLFAARFVAAGTTDAARLRQAFLLAVAREPKPAELASLQTFVGTQRDHYRANPADAEKLLRVGHAPPTAGDPSELAAWTSVARVILNLQEVITRY